MLNSLSRFRGDPGSRKLILVATCRFFVYTAANWVVYHFFVDQQSRNGRADGQETETIHDGSDPV